MNITPYWDSLSMILYIIMGVVPCIVMMQTQKNNYGDNNNAKTYYCYYIAWYVLWLAFAVFRKVDYGVGGSDAIAYVTYFDVCLDPYSTHPYATHSDLLYALLNKAIRLITTDYHWLFFVIYSFLIIVYIETIRKFNVKKASVIPLALIVFLYLRGFTSIRTNLAAGLLLISIILCFNENYVWSIFFAVGSVFMHKATIIYVLYLVLILLYKKKKLNIKTVLVFLVLSSVASRLLQNLMLSTRMSFFESGAYYSYAQRSIGNSFFSGFWKIAFSQLLLLAFLVLFRKQIDQYIEGLNEGEQKKARFVRLICYYDILLIPATFIFDIWRGYEILYLFRLMMWGIIIKSINQKFSVRTRGILNCIWFVGFIGWMIFRIYSTYESSQLMPYIFSVFT